VWIDHRVLFLKFSLIGMHLFLMLRRFLKINIPSVGAGSIKNSNIK
jgi:hypothetical protein